VHVRRDARVRAAVRTQVELLRLRCVRHSATCSDFASSRRWLDTSAFVYSTCAPRPSGMEATTALGRRHWAEVK
jgi:hypothetical protein